MVNLNRWDGEPFVPDSVEKIVDRIKAEKAEVTGKERQSKRELREKSHYMSPSTLRKSEHLALAKKFYQARKINDFDMVHLVRPTLPETAVSPESTRTDFFGARVSAPFFINAMTGGSLGGERVNRSLAKVAAEQGIAMALGSASIVEKEPAKLASFAVVREENPDGPLVVNVNPATSFETIDKLVGQLGPVALQVHVNAVQELAMPEGDSDFRWIDKIEAITAHVSVPVIIKEVGFGFDIASLRSLAQIGIRYVDVAGSGGTDFAEIENARRPGHDVDYLSGVGLSTVKSLLNARQVMAGDADTSVDGAVGAGTDSMVGMTGANMTVIASGGVRNPLDVLKSLVLGASMVGVSNRFLQTLRTEQEDGLNNMVAAWKEQLAGLVALFGASSLAQLPQIGRYFDPSIVSYMDQCGIRA
jgi:isopentenyl-diphosphate delta-isomerase